jgi:hypothetical protein
MTFSFIVITTLVALSFLGNTLQERIEKVSHPETKVLQKEEPEKIAVRESAWESKVLDPLNKDEFLDFNQDGKLEKISIYSTLGKEIGDENTKIYINDSKKSVLDLGGYFDGMQVHRIDSQGHPVLEVRTLGGHSIDTTFYTYKNNNLTIVPVSTAKPPSFYGIISRNRPEFKDVDKDGEPELLAYYNFLYDPTRKVEVYKFNGKTFNKTQEYEEANPERYQ